MVSGVPCLGGSEAYSLSHRPAAAVAGERWRNRANKLTGVLRNRIPTEPVFMPYPNKKDRIRPLPT